MGCNCGGKKGTAPSAKGTGGTKYALVLPNGTKETYDTESAARKANALIGNKGLVRKIY